MSGGEKEGLQPACDGVSQVSSRGGAWPDLGWCQDFVREEGGEGTAEPGDPRENTLHWNHRGVGVPPVYRHPARPAHRGRRWLFFP